MRIITILLALAAGVFAQAEESAKKIFKEGEHYVRLPTPVRTADPQKIEVTEVFWYGCGHCYTFEPQLKSWRRTLPDDVLFVESPAMWRGNMETHARIFYTAKTLGMLDTMHSAVFDAMHIDKMKLDRPEQIRALFEKHGVSADDFDKVFNSFSVTSSVNQAKARARSYGITGTPEIVVDGTYRISGRMAGSQANMLAVAEHLICKINADKKPGDKSTASTDAVEQARISSFCAGYAQ